MRHLTLMFLAASLTTSLAATTPALATTGKGCLRVVNVAAGDALNVRAEPSARARIVDRLIPGQHGVISLDAECTPTSRPWAQRWCPISHSSGDGTTHGYVKARFIRDAECP
ncbi:SH3 domain-containing protein [Paracoccus sp. p4-l81]|uniref:SH3 domain-containing protein n=1 Tax=unclassified Paracoccus (in: a-proteobacteria) TaxID=2688777 RepID=UPI0035B9EC97